MKKFIVFAIIAFSLFASCKAKAEDAGKTGAQQAPATEKKVSKKDVGYALGVAIAGSLKPTGVEFDYDAFVKGMKDTLEKNKPAVTVEEAQATIQAALTEAMAKKIAESAEKEKKFLEENGKKTGVKTTASGLQYEVVTEGTGAKPTATDTVKVHYTGTLTDGTKFDSSVDRGEPVVFPLDNVIPGWTEGVQLMSVGSKYKLYVPSALGYGEQGAGNVIGPNEPLIFEVELISIEKK